MLAIAAQKIIIFQLNSSNSLGLIVLITDVNIVNVDYAMNKYEN